MSTIVSTTPDLKAQGLGGAGTVQGTVRDPTGAPMIAVVVTLTNPVSGFKGEAASDSDGRFVFRNLAPNPYHLSIAVDGFRPFDRDVEIRTSVPIELDVTLTLAGAATSVEVLGHATDLLEQDPTAHTDVDRSLIEKLPTESSSGVNQIITLASPGVVADANGFFHPIGDHAQTQFSIDNQPVTDQQSRIYSNQIAPDAVQSMEVITGVPPAEFGDKDSLVVRIVTRSGLDLSRPIGAVSGSYGSFTSPGASVNLGIGDHTLGNFVSASGVRSDRYLDSPEFETLHGEGNNRSLFDRVDWHPTALDAFKANVQLGRSSFDIPNTYDQARAGQSQHQNITTFNVAPGYTRILSSNSVLAANGFVRRDRVQYTPSTNPFSDQPGTASQDRYLTNVGAKVDLSYAKGRHNVKLGGAVGATRLQEHFTIGLTDPAANSPCLDTDGVPSSETAFTSQEQCATAGLHPNTAFVAGLVPYDLTRGGGRYVFDGRTTIKQQAIYAQDDIKAGAATIKLGLRADHYDGLSSTLLVQPRLGVSYGVARTGTVLRASYGRTLETPYNENLVLSSTADPSVFGTSGQVLRPGVRDHIEAGIQQALGGWVVADVGYFYKKTTNAYDFGVLFDTPIFFPIAWDHSKLDGITARINLVDHHGVSAFTVIGHTNAIFTPPGTGGLLFEAPEGTFRIDHDQKFQQTTNVQYTFRHDRGGWIAFSWRYDSGLVAGSVPDYATALTLTADQQAAIGLYCGSAVATLTSPITSCESSNRGATRIRIPADGTEDALNNPARTTPRHLFDLGIGADNLLHTDRTKLRVRFTIVNIGNTETLYNFLSTFSGTHFVTPRAYQFEIGVRF